MLNRILPKQFDNRFRGRKLALWIYCLLLFMNVSIALVAIFKGDGGAQSADGIPLDTFGDGGARTVIAVVAILGLAKLLLWSVGVLALFRHRAMIPLMYCVIVADQLGRKAIGLAKPIVRAGSPTGVYVNWAIIVLSIVGLVLALQGRGYRSAEEPE
jgi:hypothetical protein